MNMVLHTERATRQRLPLTGLIPSVRLPVYVNLMLLVSAVIAVVVVGWTIPVRQPEQPSNAFIDYAVILPGQPLSAVLGMGFSCNSTNSSGSSEYCTRSPADGPFRLIAVTLSEGMVSRVTFTIREAALVTGDLALLWGRPNIRFYDKSLNMEWPSVGVSAEGWAENRRFSYALPVLRLSFGNPATSDSSS